MVGTQTPGLNTAKQYVSLALELISEPDQQSNYPENLWIFFYKQKIYELQSRKMELKYEIDSIKLHWLLICGCQKSIPAHEKKKKKEEECWRPGRITEEFWDWESHRGTLKIMLHMCRCFQIPCTRSLEYPQLCLLCPPHLFHKETQVSTIQKEKNKSGWTVLRPIYSSNKMCSKLTHT